MCLLFYLFFGASFRGRAARTKRKRAICEQRMADKTQNRLKSHHLSNHAATFLNSSINVYLVLFCLWLLRVIIIIMCGQFSLVLGRPVRGRVARTKRKRAICEQPGSPHR